MKALSLICVFLAAAHWSAAYSAYQRPEYSSGYSTSNSYSSSSSSTTSSAAEQCCQLNAWAYGHMDEVRQFAGKLRQEYNYMSRGSSTGYSVPSVNWHENIIHLTGKTASELDALTRRVSEQLVTDMRKGLINYGTIAQPNFFEWKAAQALELQTQSAVDLGQQQQVLDLNQHTQRMIDMGHYRPIDLSNFDEVKSYAYPSEIKVIDGKTYVVHKNCTEATKTTGDGTYENPMVTVVKRNRTIITTPGFSGTGGAIVGGNADLSSGALLGGSSYIPGGTTTRVTNKKTIYDWYNQNVEPGVIGYSPMVTVTGGGVSGSGSGSYRPPVHLPVEGSSTNSDVETISGSVGGFGFLPPTNYGPGSTVTIRRFNKTIITNADGTNTVHGSEVNKKWVDGKLVYDTERPFGEWSVPRDEAWKREERERFFWFLTQGTNTPQRLEEWQRQQEERLLALAQRYHTTVEDIQDWHRKELERYRILLGQYQAQNNDATAWQRMERGRLDWLIHQNSVTREELERWQRENQNQLAQLARQYRISLEELKRWQIEELNRLYVYFNDQNNSMITRPILPSDSLRTSEQERLEELIRQHNATIAQLHNSIKLDQQKLVELSSKYRGNVQDMEKWLKSELARLSGIINEQRTEMTRITEWQRSERERLENIMKNHRGSVVELETQMARDRSYIQSLAAKYHVSIEELEKWQRDELARLHNVTESQLHKDIEEWQRRERERLMAIIRQNDLTIEEFQTQIVNDRARLEQLAKTYKVQVSEVEEWIKQELKNFQNQGLLKEVVEKELAAWQQQERERLLAIVRQNELTVEELQQKIKQDQSHLFTLAHQHQVRVEEIEEWLKKELLRLQGQGLIKAEDLQDWQQKERNDIMRLVQQNKLTIEEFEQKLLADRQRLQDLSKTYNVQTTEIEQWIKKEGERLQNLGLIQMQEQLEKWQQIERERLLVLVQQNNLTIGELEQKIKQDQVHLYTLAHQHQVRVEEIEAWIKQELQKLQQQGLIEMGKLKDWQSEWRGNLTNMVRERDFTVEEFHKWLLEDRQRLQALAMTHNVQIEELEQWVKNEEQRFISMGLLKPNEKLTNWQEVERRYLERITQQQYHSTEQLEQRLRQDRELLEKLARDYSVQVEEIEGWMKKELVRLRDDGQLQIDDLTAWQIAERERIEALINQNQKWSVEEFEALLRQDREHMQKMAFQYHTSVEEIEKWVQAEVERLRQQGKLDMQKLTAWQQAEQQRIFNLLQQQSGVTVEEFERKVQQDRRQLMQLSRQYHVSVNELEEYVRRVIEELRAKGQFEVKEQLQVWQLVERDYIKQLIAQFNNGLTTDEYEQKLLADRTHLRQLADQYRISVEQIEKWMVEELKRLRAGSEQQVQQLAAWQVAESQRLKNLIKENNHLSYVQYEVELMKERERLQQLAKQYSLSVEEIEQWLRQQLVNLKTTGQVQVESLTQWQQIEQKRLIDLLLQKPQLQSNYEEFEVQLGRDRTRLQQLAQQHSISVEQIERWMRDELQRLKQSGLVQMEQLTYWQKIERERLQNWLEQQQHAVSFAEFNDFLNRDRSRLQRISTDYHVTVEEVERWVQQEAARLQLLGMIQRPGNWSSEVSWFWESNDNDRKNHTGIWSSDSLTEEMWKVHTRAHLQAVAQVKQMNWQDFERYLTEERMRWEQFARQYNITVEEIELWLREAAKELAQQGVITGSVTVEDWQIEEQQHIADLINEKLRQQQQWSIEELLRQLIHDRAHLQQLAQQYHLAVEQIEAWYKQELRRLLEKRKIISEQLTEWQIREKERIFGIVQKQPSISLQMLEQKLLKDREILQSLANEYRITIEELEVFTQKELQRLVSLGLVRDLTAGSNYNLWQEKERQRLRAITAELTITEEELLEFISADNAFQQQLARIYGVQLEQLAPFQRIEIGVMQREGLFDHTQLLTLTSWQRRERDRLYSLIKNQNFSLKNLKDWQRQDIYLREMATKYGIELLTLKQWQLQEYERLQQLAAHYKFTLQQLLDFRDKELRYITHIMHKQLSTEEERIDWSSQEAQRMAILERKSGLSGEELWAWRRRLYLLCQGLLPMNFGGAGGFEQGSGFTNFTAPPQQTISKDRGDQPPNVYDEVTDTEEPGLAGQSSNPLHPPPMAQFKSTTPTPSAQYLPPVGGGGGGAVQSGYRYTKKEYKFTVPVGVATASANADAHGSSATASVSSSAAGYGRRDVPQHEIGSASHTVTGQQEQKEIEDFGQQQEELDDYKQGHVRGHAYGRYSNQQKHQHQQQHQSEDFGQQQQVELADFKQEDLGQQQVHEQHHGRGNAYGHYTHGRQDGQQAFQQQQVTEDLGQQQVELDDYKQEDLGQQQVQVEDLRGTGYGASQKQVDAQANAQVEVTAKEEPGFWGKLKEKTTNIFG